MSGFARRFDDRTGLLSALKKFGARATPARGGWLFTLGSASLFVLALQFVTGACLATAYAPTPDHARASVWFIETRLPEGSLIRGLHHWGTSFLVVLCLAHLLRVAYHGAYKEPRQFNWGIGLLLLLLLLGFAFTGYLLPWDQKGYWATVVGVRIAASVPGAGPAGARLLSGSGGVGASALSRFAAIHCVILPAAVALLVGLHLVLLRRHGHAGLPGDTSPREPFFPRQLARDCAVALLLFAALLFVARYYPAPLEGIADLTDTSYAPRPEWYFLSLFQLLHYFKGRAEILATAGIPIAVGLLLFGLPLLDRRADREPRKRLLWIGIPASILAGAALLTAIAMSENPAAGSRVLVSEPPPPPSAWLSAGALQNYDLSAQPASVLRGGKLIASKKCLECHLIQGDGNGKGIALKHVAGRRDKSWLLAHFRDPQGLVPHSKMPPLDDLPDRDLSDMADYLLALP
jgi:ubiquinol-cytochrome c reductase cytochrome b subunit